MAGSWLSPTITGVKPYTLDATAATVLNTGEVILANELGGVYRGAVSGEREH